MKTPGRARCNCFLDNYIHNAKTGKFNRDASNSAKHSGAPCREIALPAAPICPPAQTVLPRITGGMNWPPGKKAITIAVYEISGLTVRIFNPQILINLHLYPWGIIAPGGATINTYQKHNYETTCILLLCGAGISSNNKK